MAHDSFQAFLQVGAAFPDIGKVPWLGCGWTYRTKGNFESAAWVYSRLQRPGGVSGRTAGAYGLGYATAGKWLTASVVACACARSLARRAQTSAASADRWSC
jgi:hypothetical protein